MLFRPIAGALGLLAILVAPALSQPYPIATEAPRTTNTGALRTLAIDREIHERFQRGLAAESRNAWKEAADQFSRIVALNPSEPRGSTAHYDLGIAQAQLAQYAAASASFQEALKRDPGFTAAAANLVTVALMAGDTKTARAAGDRFVNLAPASARARYSRGLIALRENDFETARADFHALIAADPGYAIAHFDLAVVEIEAARFDAATAELERALALSPGYARARFALGVVYFRQGKRAEAADAFGRAAVDASDLALRASALDMQERAKAKP